MFNKNYHSMKNYIFIVLFSASLLSCSKDTPKVKHVKKMTPGVELKGVKVVNAEDPICKMKTAEYLNDTAIYKGKVYGFCSDHCKKEFKKNPEKYASE